MFSLRSLHRVRELPASPGAQIFHKLGGDSENTDNFRCHTTSWEAYQSQVVSAWLNGQLATVLLQFPVQRVCLHHNSRGITWIANVWHNMTRFQWAIKGVLWYFYEKSTFMTMRFRIGNATNNNFYNNLRNFDNLLVEYQRGLIEIQKIYFLKYWNIEWEMTWKT